MPLKYVFATVDEKSVAGKQPFQNSIVLAFEAEMGTDSTLLAMFILYIILTGYARQHKNEKGHKASRSPCFDEALQRSGERMNASKLYKNQA